MKKYLFLISIFTGTSILNNVYAQQPFEFLHDEVSASTIGTDPDDAGDEFVIPNKLKNISTNPFTFNWRFLNPEVRPTAWTYSGFCDNNTCYISGWQEGQVKESFTVEPGEESDFKLQLKLPIGIAADATAAFKFEAKVGDYADTATFIVTKGTTGVNVIKVDDTRINIFPNPSEGSRINIYIDKALDANKIFIYDMMGRLVISQDVSKSDEFNVVDHHQLSSGIHFIQITNEMNVTISNRKFVKK